MIEASVHLDGARRATPRIELLRSPGNPAIQVASALDGVRRAPTILEAMRTLGEVIPAVDAALAEGVDDVVLELIHEAVADDSDTVAGLVAVHALARVPGPRAAIALADLVADGQPGFEEHALWALSGRETTHLLAWPVARAIGRGGFSGMLAQRTLATWAATDPHLVHAALEAVLTEMEAPSARRHLVETMGFVPSRLAQVSLTRIALDSHEHESVRRTAVLAFSEPWNGPIPAAFATLEGTLGGAVRTARAHRRLLQRGPRRAAHGDGVRVAQVHLGETGGLATLLPQLGDALAGQQRVAEPLTIIRAGAQVPTTAAGHRLESVALEQGEGSSFNGRWPATVTISRAVRAAFLAGPLPDVVHVRMADPATYATAEVALSYGIPLVFTFAPDPHGPIAAAEASGALDRRSFAMRDAQSAHWFRASLVERLAREARELVLFPREGLREDLERLTATDLTSGPPRHTVVAEGIDLGSTDRAAAIVSSDVTAPPVLADLAEAIGQFPPERQGLPLVVSAGRLIELKGMARLVAAFGQDTSLAARANLVIVGGDLADPSAAEAAELARIQGHLEAHPGLRDRVVLLGHRSHEEVATVLAAARLGWSSLIGPGGSYACASMKEEFGLAIVEALAAGLPVTAPLAGGPATYVEPGRSGTLVDTTDIDALASAIGTTLDLAADPATATHTRSVVEQRYTLERMARSLTAVYRVTVGAATLAAAVDEHTEAAA
jgi:glycosyltransferase involved in cell wall biosynthesis